VALGQVGIVRSYESTRLSRNGTDPVDQQVVVAFFHALAPAELDRYEQAMQRRRHGQADGARAPHYAVQRLR
jgi:hypothetical protein